MLKPAFQNLAESSVTQHRPSWVYDYMRFIFLFLLRLFVFSTHPKSFSLVASKSSPLSNPRTLNLSLIYTSKSQVIKGWVVFMAWRFVFGVWILLMEERPWKIKWVWVEGDLRSLLLSWTSPFLQRVCSSLSNIKHLIKQATYLNSIVFLIEPTNYSRGDPCIQHSQMSCGPSLHELLDDILSMILFYFNYSMSCCAWWWLSDVQAFLYAKAPTNY